MRPLTSCLQLIVSRSWSLGQMGKQLPGLQRSCPQGRHCPLSLGACRYNDAWKGWGDSLEAPIGSSLALSQETCNINEFLSHDWGTSRPWKFLTLLMIFNARLAFIASSLVNVLVSVLAISFREKQLWPCFLSHITFWTCLFWVPSMRHRFRTPIMVFLDRLCIAQHDAELKEKGIMGLATFLMHSEKLTILWSPRG